MAVDQKVQKLLLDDDALYCEEEVRWGGSDEEEEESGITDLTSFPHQILLEQDLFWDDEQLQSLFCKERDQVNQGVTFPVCRKEAVGRILRVNAHYGFSALTAILAVNYLDRFLCSLSFERDKPWMVHLTAVTCFSLAAKVEETYVPLLLDLQMEGCTEYVFEAKTIQRMELLVLSALKWKMNPVTPLSFIDHIIRRLGLKCYVHWKFLRSCENLLLSIVSDSRSVSHRPSVLATATMLHVIHRAEPGYGTVAYENQLLDVLKISPEEVDECYDLVSDIMSNSRKRAMDPVFLNPGEPMFGTTSYCGSSSSPVWKRRRVHEQQMIRLPSQVFVEGVGSTPH